MRVQGTLDVELSHATNLESMDSNGFSDPYVVLKVAGQQRRSSTVQKTLNPKWKQHFEFPLLTKQQARAQHAHTPGSALAAIVVVRRSDAMPRRTFEPHALTALQVVRERLEINAMDWDFLSSDDPLGDASLDLSVLQHERQHTFKAALSTQGHVHLRVTWREADEPSTRVTLDDQLDVIETIVLQVPFVA